MNETALLWSNLQKQKQLYVVTESDLILIENEDFEPESTIRLFLDAEQAKEYKEMVIERDDLQPSQVNVETFTLHDIFSLIPELETIAEEFYETKLKIDVVFFDGSGMLEDTLYISNTEMN